MIRKKGMKALCAGFALAGILTFGQACSKNSNDTSSLYIPTQADTTAIASLQDLQQGRILYIDNCGQCHGLYSPDDYNATQWSSILSGMVPRTGLNTTQAALVKKYVTRGKD